MPRSVYLVLLVAFAAILPGVSAHAGGPRMYLRDACIETGVTTFVMPLVLAGSDERPTSIRATLLYDPASLTLLDAPGEPAVRPGAGLRGTNTQFSYESTVEIGEVSIVLNSAGRLPVAPLPVGALAEIRFTLRPQTVPQYTLRVEFDAGRTRSVDGAGREMFTLTEIPAIVWVGQAPLHVQVGALGENGSTAVQVSGLPPERAAVLMRGQSSQLLRRPKSVTFGDLVPMGAVISGRPLEDATLPPAGEAFYYVAAQPDGTGGSALGFGSGCRARQVHVDVSRRD